MTQNKEDKNLLSQEEVNELLAISNFIKDTTKEAHKSLIDEIRDAILDSAKLSIQDWKNLRAKLKEIEELIPHIDLIIKLKERDKFRK